MKNILIAIERSRFNYLYKYDCCSTSMSHIIQWSYEELKSLIAKDSTSVSQRIEEALPVFEREEEVFLIEADASKVSFDLQFSFDAVLKIIPLNGTAKELLEVKLNSDFEISEPLDDQLFSEIQVKRELKLRIKLASDLLGVLHLSAPKDEYQIIANKSIARKISNVNGKAESIIDVLLDLNTTPVEIPTGKIEGLMKIICVGLLKATGHTDQLRKSPLYQLLLNNYEEINRKSIQSAFELFEELTRNNQELIAKLYETVNTKEFEGEIFKLCYYYFTIKKILVSSEGDIKALMLELEGEDVTRTEFSQAVYLVGMVLSYNVLFESIQKLKFAQLFGVKKADLPKAEYYIGETVDLTSNTNEVNDDLYLNKDTPQEIKPQASAVNLSSEETLGVDEKEALKEDSGLLFKKESTDARMELIYTAKKSIKGKGSKEVLNLLNSLYKSNKSFSYKELKKGF